MGAVKRANPGQRAIPAWPSCMGCKGILLKVGEERMKKEKIKRSKQTKKSQMQTKAPVIIFED